MTETNHRGKSASRLVHLWERIRMLWPRRRTAARKALTRRAEAVRPRLGMESLEQRTTISDAMLGFVLPALWSTASPSALPGLLREQDSGGAAAQPADLAGSWEALCLVPTAQDSTEVSQREEAAAESAPVLVSAEADALWSAAPWFQWAVTPFAAPATERAAELPSAAQAPTPLAGETLPGREGVGALSVLAGTVPRMSAPDALSPPELGTLAGIRPPESGTQGQPLTSGPSATQFNDFEVSWQSGRKDPTGQYMSATEILHLAAHNGKLFAGTSVWMNYSPGDPQVGAMILRLDSPRGQWVVEKHWNEFGPSGFVRQGRVTALKVMTFTTDGRGQPLPQPVNILLASTHDRTGRVAVWSRNDATGTWTEMVLGQSANEADSQIRAFGFHRDQVTGVDLVFASAEPLGVFRGWYDPARPGRIRWFKEIELVHSHRGMSFAEANGSLYMSIKPEVFVRIDGRQPSWRSVLRYPEPPYLGEGIRAMTTIPALSGGGEVLLATFETGGAFVVRILPQLGHIYIIELDVREWLRARWGELGATVVIAGYNDTTPVLDPYSGRMVHLIGLFAVAPATMRRTSSWYLVRYPDATFDLREIRALPHPFLPNPVLLGNRSMVISPFPEDKGQYVYYAGYDPTFLPARHTGWIYRSSLLTALYKEPGP